MSASSSLRALLVIASTGVASAHAQSTNGASDFMRRSSVSLSVVQSRPQGAFARNVELGYGLDGAYIYRLDAAGVWSIRASVGALSYGNESRPAAFSESVGGRVQVNVSTTNYIVPLSIGPQVSWPTGRVRPYANAGVGGQIFFSESRVQGTDNLVVLASTTNHSSSAASWSLGGGINMPLYVGRTSVHLDVGAQYVNGGTARYLSKGSIVDLPGAQISVTPRESSTRMMIVHLGARVQR